MCVVCASVCVLCVLRASMCVYLHVSVWHACTQVHAFCHTGLSIGSCLLFNVSLLCQCVGLTIYIRCVYSNFVREITEYTVIFCQGNHKLTIYIRCVYSNSVREITEYTVIYIFVANPTYAPTAATHRAHVWALLLRSLALCCNLEPLLPLLQFIVCSRDFFWWSYLALHCNYEVLLPVLQPIVWALLLHSPVWALLLHSPVPLLQFWTAAAIATPSGQVHRKGCLL